MNAEYDIAVNLVSAAIGASVGASWTYGVNIFRYRQHRAFWRFLEKPTVFVVGDLAPSVLLGTLPDVLKDVTIGQQDPRLITERIMSHLNTQEISGLIGRGDLDAIVSLVWKFASMRFTSRPVVLHPSQVRDRIDHNLILIGGRDTNSLTNTLAPRLGCRLETLMNDEGHNVIRDSRLNVDHPVTWQGTPDASGEISRMDYGILARGRNPHNPEREVLLVAGAHGLGSLAAAEICLNPKFEKRLYNDLRQYNGNFECLVSYKKVEGGPSDGQVTIDLEFSRSLDGQRANS
jgi:hypothetical protein